MEGHKHECPECKTVLTCNNPAGCPGVGAQAFCGAHPFVKWADLIHRGTTITELEEIVDNTIGGKA